MTTSLPPGDRCIQVGGTSMKKTILPSTLCKDHTSLLISAQQSALARRHPYDYVLIEQAWICARNWSHLTWHPQPLIPSQMTAIVLYSMMLRVEDRNETRTKQNFAIPFESSSRCKPCEKTLQLECEVILDRVSTLCEVMYGRAWIRR